jgi:hypothetical protein
MQLNLLSAINGITGPSRVTTATNDTQVRVFQC